MGSSLLQDLVNQKFYLFIYDYTKMKRKIIMLPAAILCSAGTVPVGDTPWYLVGGIVGYWDGSEILLVWVTARCQRCFFHPVMTGLGEIKQTPGD